MSKADPNSMANAAGIAYGELIRRQRRARKMSQEELGALVRGGKNAVGAWEAGRSRPDVGSVPVICKALDLSLEEFFGLQDVNSPAGLKEGVTPAEASEVVRRYAALNPYNRQVAMREMEMLYDMQVGMKEVPRRVLRLYMNDLAASAGPGETLEVSRGEEVFLFAGSLTENADEIIRVNGDSMEPTLNNGDIILLVKSKQYSTGQLCCVAWQNKLLLIRARYSRVLFWACLWKKGSIFRKLLPR